MSLLQPHIGMESDPVASPLGDVGSHVGPGPPLCRAGAVNRACWRGWGNLPVGFGGDADKIPRPPSAGAVVLQTARNKPLEKRLGSHSEGLSYLGSLLCGVNYLLSLSFWLGFFLLFLWIISWQTRRRFKALSSAPSELLAAKWYVGDPGLKKTPKNTPSEKSHCLCSANMGSGAAQEDFVCVPGAVSSGELEQQPPVGSLARRIPPGWRWDGGWCFPGSTKQHRAGWERLRCRATSGRGECGGPLGVASGGGHLVLAGLGAVWSSTAKSSLDWGAWRETPSLWEGVRVML